MGLLDEEGLLHAGLIGVGRGFATIRDQARSDYYRARRNWGDTMRDPESVAAYQRKLDDAERTRAEDTRHYAKLAREYPVTTGAGEALPAGIFGPGPLFNALAVNVMDRSIAESLRKLGILDADAYSLIGSGWAPAGLLASTPWLPR